jgi:tankyrase
MKHPRFESLGSDYPIHLEERFDRILTDIDQLWDKPELDAYFTDLLIDKRGGRKGFHAEVLAEIVKLRDLRELSTLRKAERKEDAIRELARRGISLAKENFLRAVNEGDRETVDLFVRSNFNIHIADKDGNSPLMIALKKGHTVIAKILLDGGADVNKRDALGLTPLLISCGNTTQGYKTIAETLIKKSALVNVHDKLGFTPLLLTLSGGNIEIAKLLIENGADVSVRTNRGESALFLASESKSADREEVVNLLIGKGADL